MGITAAMLMTLLAASVSRLPSRQAELVSADVGEVKKGYRSGWLLGHSVINDQDERIGTIADLVLGQDYALSAVLEVGGFLGLGGHLVAVPIRALQFERDGRKLVLPGATRKSLRNFPEFKFEP
jgi:hypothetical protein